ncbi:MAG: thioredoxin domain-containing protein [Verrucomicrobiota bacterium]
MSALPDITAAEFEAEILRSEKPVLIDFYGTHCSPCRRMLPVLEEIAAERADKIRVVKINAHEQSEVAVRFRIGSVPNFLLIRGGEVVGQRIGLTPKRDLLEWLDSTVA